MIREAGPVVYFPRYDVWATGRHEHIETMMRDWKTFSSTRPPFEETGQPMILLSDDPPDHQRVRTVISKAMAPSAMRRMQDAFEREAENTVAEFPAQYELLRSDIAEHAKRALEEGLRYDNPARFTRRRTTVPVNVGGVSLPADAKILILHMPGGRDPRRWENPEVYDLSREVVGNHLGFGFGVHTCVGARIARMEAVCLLSALARRVARIELAGTPEVTANMAVHGHERLPLRLFPSQEAP